MIPENRMPTPPGEMLAEEFLKPLGLSQKAFADMLGIGRDRLNEIINGKRSITPSTALRLAKALGTTPQFWLNGQLLVDLYRAEHDADEISAVDRITPVHQPTPVPCGLDAHERTGS